MASLQDNLDKLVPERQSITVLKYATANDGGSRGEKDVHYLPHDQRIISALF